MTQSQQSEQPEDLSGTHRGHGLVVDKNLHGSEESDGKRRRGALGGEDGRNPSVAGGSKRRKLLVAARDELIARGVDVSEVFHFAGGPFNNAVENPRVVGRDPEGRSYSSFASFEDPDGNGWLLQEITSRLPGREWKSPQTQSADASTLAALLHETAERHGHYEQAHAEGADVVLTGRNLERLQKAAIEIGAESTAAFDATGFERLQRFFDALPTPVDHVMVSGGGPYYVPLADIDFEQARRDIEQHLLLPLHIARNAAARVRPGGTLLFLSGTGGRRPGVGMALIATITAALPALTKALALELAPIRVNLIAPGFVDTPLSATLLGSQLDERRDQLRTTLPIRRVVGPADVAALAVHLMTNTALTGATYDIDGGQQLVET
ncbi:MAG: putative 3-oxoacyl-[acyl-carrier-protein] reductase [Chthonomonadales bacterium]|nr:putative 3-oxoacyl-[acyl-carrier-protein] reductase [Chthonomonadales bacterium]